MKRATPCVSGNTAGVRLDHGGVGCVRSHQPVSGFVHSGKWVSCVRLDVRLDTGGDCPIIAPFGAPAWVCRPHLTPTPPCVGRRTTLTPARCSLTVSGYPTTRSLDATTRSLARRDHALARSTRRRARSLDTTTRSLGTTRARSTRLYLYSSRPATGPLTWTSQFPGAVELIYPLLSGGARASHAPVPLARSGAPA